MDRPSYYRPRGSCMKPLLRRCRGYSLIELLTVLVIVGILAMVGVFMLGNRRSAAVREVMDELEGTLSSAHKLAVATGRDVMVATQGDWDGAGTPLIMAYGDATAGAATILANGQTASEAFRVALNQSGGLRREHMYAGIVTVGHNTWWATALGASTDLDNVAPFNDSNSGFKTADIPEDTTAVPPTPAVPGHSILQEDSQNLFKGGTTMGAVRVSGANKRFTTTFWIKVVSLSNGLPTPNAPMGVLVVQRNGAQIYKFYNPGKTDGGNGTWRRL